MSEREGFDAVSIDRFAELERVRAGDLADEHDGRRVFMPGVGTMLVGDRPVYGVNVIGAWWTIARVGDRWEATSDRGVTWEFDPAVYADRTLYMDGAS